MNLKFKSKLFVLQFQTQSNYSSASPTINQDKFFRWIYELKHWRYKQPECTTKGELDNLACTSGAAPYSAECTTKGELDDLACTSGAAPYSAECTTKGELDGLACTSGAAPYSAEDSIQEPEILKLNTKLRNYILQHIFG